MESSQGNRNRDSELDFRQAERWSKAGRPWEADREIERILSADRSLEETRDKLYTYLDFLDRRLRRSTMSADELDLAKAREAVGVFRNLISPANEVRAGFSTLELMRQMTSERDEEVTDPIGEGFTEEIHHLLLAIHGKTGVGKGWMGREWALDPIVRSTAPVFRGENAGRMRSSYLDLMAAAARRRIETFPCGLDESLRQERDANRDTILGYFGGRECDWRDPDWQRKHILRGRAGLRDIDALVRLSSAEKAAIAAAVDDGIPWAITPYYLSLFDFRDTSRRRDGQVRSQVIPPLHTVARMIEHRNDRGDAFDFMGEHDTSPVDWVTRRYPMVAILKLTEACPQICVYCQRNWEIEADAVCVAHSNDQIDRALGWFARHPAIADVLVTGGDPLAVDKDQFLRVLGGLAALSHISHIRIGTRVPVTMPMLINKALAGRIGAYVEPGRRGISVVTHIESALEVTPELAQAVHQFRQVGVAVYNQMVYTLETSRRFQAVAARMAMKQAGVDPYYTFYTKGKEEHRDYLVPIARVLQERKEEARLLPGVFRTDEPVFNVPKLGKNHLRASQDRELIAIRADGSRVYLFHPWEKGIAPVKPWLYVDRPIHGYFARLERLGENPVEYESIWTYY
ncbi:KamA family radical SAM protein [Candidatus Bipolaricaulota bacterium]|nr:KamA family radical SAM protein [Candidatus Bipolaricaulota bacterium]